MEKTVFENILKIHADVTKGAKKENSGDIIISEGDWSFFNDDCSLVAQIQGEGANCVIPLELIKKIKKIKKYKNVNILDNTIKYDTGLTIVNGNQPAIKNISVVSAMLEGKDLLASYSIDGLTALVKEHKASVSDDKFRYFMNGIFLEYDGSNKIIATSTDGRRLSTNTYSVTPIREGEGSAIVPLSLFVTASKYINGITVFNFYDGVVEATNVDGSIRLFVKTIQGQFPNYRRVIPVTEGNSKEFTNVEIPRLLFLDKLMTIKAVMDKDVAIILDMTAGVMQAEGANMPMGWSINADELKFDGRIKFNINFLIDMLNSYESNPVAYFPREAPNRATVYKGKEQHTSVIMPMIID